MSKTRTYISAYALSSAIGSGREQTLQSLLSEQSGLQQCQLQSNTAVCYLGHVAGLDEVSIPETLRSFDSRNARLAEQALGQDGFLPAVEVAIETYGADRIGVILGTSTSGIATGEAAYQHFTETGQFPNEFNFRHQQELSALSEYVSRRLRVTGVTYTISTACTSSTLTFAHGASLLEAGLADAVIVGGVDTLCDTSIYGFKSLELLSPVPCCPNDQNRKGISLGEAGGFALLTKEAKGAVATLLGYGESSDAHHMSSPHPEGVGARQAMLAALESAGLTPDQIDYINLHGTGSIANDRVEERAIRDIFGSDLPVSSTKGWTGHTLGAAGMIDSAITLLALEHNFLPRNLNLTQVSEGFECRILTESLSSPLSVVMSNNFGFGGSNCSLVFGGVDHGEG